MSREELACDRSGDDLAASKKSNLSGKLSAKRSRILTIDALLLSKQPSHSDKIRSEVEYFKGVYVISLKNL